MSKPAVQDGQESGGVATAPAKPRKAPTSKPKREPPYAVVLHNDDFNTVEFVVETLQKVFGYDLTKAMELTLEAHKTGRSCVWSGHRELAELKAEQIVSRGPDPVMRDLGARPLRVTVEPLPSE